MHVLIAESDSNMATLVGESVRTLWGNSTITTVTDGQAALRAFAMERPRLAILESMMPSPDGLALCRHFRQADADLPILMLSMSASVLDEVRAFDAGADNVLPMPLDPRVLVARLRALARRMERPGKLSAGRATDSVRVGKIAIDFLRRQVHIDGRAVELSPTEYVLLEALARNIGQLMPHRTLLEYVWGSAYANETRYLKVFINRLRRKLGDDGQSSVYIETHRGQGYRFSATS